MTNLARNILKCSSEEANRLKSDKDFVQSHWSDGKKKFIDEDFTQSDWLALQFFRTMKNKQKRIFHTTEKQEKNRKTLGKELTEGEWMTEKHCNAHFVLMSLR